VYVFGSPGSGSVITCTDSDSSINKKYLDVPTVSTGKKQKKCRKNLFFVVILEATEEKSRIRIRHPVVVSHDPDPYQNVTYPEHWKIPKVINVTRVRIQNLAFGLFDSKFNLPNKRLLRI
jgi:hypothetical protein